MAATPLAVRRPLASATHGRAVHAAGQHTVMPYDHAASFELSGVPGNVVAGVINIGIDGTFVATAIGYGLEEQRERGVTLASPGTPIPDGLRETATVRENK